MNTLTVNGHPITCVCYTYALPDGLWVEYDNKAREWLHREALLRLFGREVVGRMFHVAHNNGWTGQWYAWKA